MAAESSETLDAMNKRFAEMEAEAAKLKQMQEAVEQQLSTDVTEESKQETDSRSIHVANVDYSSTPEEIQAHFQSCGTINRVTIICDKWTGHPKGFAYVEFATQDSVKNSLALNDSMFKGRVIQVTAKRTNLPSFMMRGRGRGGRGGRGFRGRGRGFRGRGRGAAPQTFAPY